MAPKKSAHLKPYSRKQSERFSINCNGSTQSNLKLSSISKNRKLVEKPDRVGECRAMLKSELESLQTEVQSNLKLVKNVLHNDRGTPVQNVIHRGKELHQTEVCLPTKSNAMETALLLDGHESPMDESDSVDKLQHHPVVDDQNVHHNLSKRDGQSLQHTNVQQGKNIARKGGKIEEPIRALNGKPMDGSQETSQGNSSNVRKRKLPGSNSFRELDCVVKETFRHNLASGGDTPALHCESISGISVIETTESNGGNPIKNSPKTFNTNLDLESSNCESAYSERDSLSSKFDVQLLERKVLNGRDIELKYLQQSFVPTDISAAVCGKMSNITPNCKNDCNYKAIEKNNLVNLLDRNEICVDEKERQSVPSQACSKNPVFGFYKEEPFSIKRCSPNPPEDYVRANKEHMSTESLEGGPYSPEISTSVSPLSSGNCDYFTTDRGSLNREMNHPYRDINNNEIFGVENFVLSINMNLGNVVKAKRKRVCSLSEQYASTKSVPDCSTNLPVVEAHNVQRLLSCRSCSFRAISEAILEQHTLMHEKLSAVYTDERVKSTDVRSEHIFRAGRPREKLFRKRELSLSNVSLFSKSKPRQAKRNYSILSDTLHKSSTKTPGYSDAINTLQIFYCKYCNFSCNKQQKQANHVRYCPWSVKNKMLYPSNKAKRRKLTGVATESSQTLHEDEGLTDGRIPSSANEATPKNNLQESELRAISSGYFDKVNHSVIKESKNSIAQKQFSTSVRDLCREVMYKCSLCDFSSVVLSTFTRHIKYHNHQNNQTTLRCPMCPYETSDGAEMKRHFSESGIHGPTYSLERGNGGEFYGMDQELELFHTGNTCDTKSHESTHEGFTNYKSETLWTTDDKIHAEESVDNNSTEVPASAIVSLPNAKSNSNDASMICSDGKTSHRRGRRATNITKTNGAFTCSESGCIFVALRLKGLKSHERSGKHVYLKQT